MKDNNSNSNINFYSVLELSNYSSYDLIKSKYKELVKIHHPDKGGDPYTFDRIVYAYEFLKDEKKKSEFDRKLKCNIFLIVSNMNVILIR
jgi:curved DNA-binding protein CbpA